MTPPSAAPRQRLSTSPFAAKEAVPALQIAVADRVTHDKFGLGRVESVGEGYVIVAFGSERVRVTSPFSRLSPL